MSIADFYQSSEHSGNLAHFAAIVNLALIDGELNSDEEIKLKRLAYKLNISDEEYNTILKNPSKFPIRTLASAEERLERLYDFFKIVYADHLIDEDELHLLERYAIGLGFNPEKADIIIKKSMKIFGGDIGFDDYEYLINH
jgi:uncharacterized tellurite resistance protein B-like protein